jgi:hypothetical protein
MPVPPAKMLDQIIGLQRSWWLQYLTELAKLLLSK